MSTTLGDEFPKEQARLRELLVAYREIGSVGAFGAHVIEHMLQEADAAAISGDLVRMIRVYNDMKECQ